MSDDDSCCPWVEASNDAIDGCLNDGNQKGQPLHCQSGRLTMTLTRKGVAMATTTPKLSSVGLERLKVIHARRHPHFRGQSDMDVTEHSGKRLSISFKRSSSVAITFLCRLLLSFPKRIRGLTSSMQE
ncbi:hypothetical protein LSAT2_015767 [Lamellibrachia satsuma]|nr:hypothetical protein LSAT2_015767 [Lamellibrachia satsuma]